MILSHLKKLFAGIHAVKFHSEKDGVRTSIVTMKSLDGEQVPLQKPVMVTNNVEV